MQYSLTQDEIEKVCDLVRMVVDCTDCDRETMNPTKNAERIIVELAYDINRFIQ